MSHRQPVGRASGPASISSRLVAGLFVAVPALLLAASAAAQTAVERTLHDFDEDVTSCFYCSAPPIEGSDHALYGTTPSGGAYDWGLLYRFSAAKGYQVLHDFGESVVSFHPMGAPVQLANGDLYGVTLNPTSSGPERPGALWRYTHNGRYQVLDRFRGPNGVKPTGLMATPDGRIFGTCYDGGHYGKGVLFRVDDTGHAVPVHSFSSAGGATTPYYVPTLASDGALYGVTLDSAGDNVGAIWRFGPDGTFSVLHTFSAATDGTYPSSRLMQASDGALYGMMRNGPGPADYGTVYRITLDGTYSNFHVFAGTDGAFPLGGLTQDAAGNLVGATESSTDETTIGTVFRIALDGTLSTLHRFDPAHDGSFPNGVTLGSDGKDYGLAAYGGAVDHGTLWQLALP